MIYSREGLVASCGLLREKGTNKQTGEKKFHESSM